jgi:DHA1 family tetracycline resistance protein-like MFS transporter
MFSMCSGVERALLFLTAPFLGALSDLRGRRPVLLFSITMPALALLGVLLWPSPALVLAYYIACGCCNVTSPLINAAVTDLAREGGEADVAQQFGRLGVALGLGLIMGPVTGPMLARVNVLAPIMLSLALSAVSLLLL